MKKGEKSQATNNFVLVEARFLLEGHSERKKGMKNWTAIHSVGKKRQKKGPMYSYKKSCLPKVGFYFFKSIFWC